MFGSHSIGLDKLSRKKLNFAVRQTAVHKIEDYDQKRMRHCRHQVKGSIVAKLWRFESLTMWGIGLLFLTAGLLHELNPFYFYKSIVAYNIVSLTQALVLASIIPKLQILIGLCMLLGVLRRGALIGTCLLFVIFAFAGIIALLNDTQISCGCIGAIQLPVNWLHVFVVAIMFSATVLCLIRVRNGNFNPEVAAATDERSHWAVQE